ncbi:MarR family winged helix-turn-helix transcriptional regulator [Nocardia jinanensis]|uniref:HTH marR-type domain-containing protein n=1 Tax=Nocardia jinanensis TaxID=382504 RepID=A0A917VQS9_9NOCA|nr:MarR family winged helix-turn-helix transcriptional regulator [Nocardia jinanensis]GGL09467.1 hypothetical protein GCM10011588_24800 [Nocardia jinanensis]
MKPTPGFAFPLFRQPVPSAPKGRPGSQGSGTHVVLPSPSRITVPKTTSAKWLPKARSPVSASSSTRRRRAAAERTRSWSPPVERRAHPIDRPAKQLVLTAAGGALRERLLDLLAADSPLQPLSQQEQRTLQHLLERAVTAD